jgi:hypothetical protein
MGEERGGRRLPAAVDLAAWADIFDKEDLFLLEHHEQDAD